MSKLLFEHGRTRSRFYIKVYLNDNSTTICANLETRYLINVSFPYLEDSSPTGWRCKENDFYVLWLPDDCIDHIYLDKLKDWAEQANQHIWLGLNKNIYPFFIVGELDFCVAADWNYSFDAPNKRTPIGEAEYQLKYKAPLGLVPSSQVFQYEGVVKNAIMSCVGLLPKANGNLVVTTIPATQGHQHGFAYSLARFVAQKLQVPFVKITLTNEKPQMKNQTVEDKLKIWDEIYSNPHNLDIPYEICGKDILIIDDLYQSGTSIWRYAQYLKDLCNVKYVIAATLVKSLKDSDNK